MNATPATIADFAAWLDGQQEQASTGMQTTEGEAFGTHCDLAIEVITARSMLLKFTAELREQASASPCTNCRDNFPLPTGPMDVIDQWAVNDFISRRTACTLRPAGAKPCLVQEGGAA